MLQDVDLKLFFFLCVHSIFMNALTGGHNATNLVNHASWIVCHKD